MADKDIATDINNLLSSLTKKKEVSPEFVAGLFVILETDNFITSTTNTPTYMLFKFIDGSEVKVINAEDCL